MTFDKVPLRRLVECLDGKRVPLNREQRADMAGNVPYWGSGGIVDHIDEYLFDEPLVLLGEDGAPFFDKDRPVSFVIEGRSWVNNHIHVLRPRIMEPRFLSCALNAVDYGRYISGSTRDKLTQEEMWMIRIPHPALDQQRRIADFLDDQVARLDAAIGVQDRQKRLLLERFRSELAARTLLDGASPGAERTRVKYLFEYERNGIWGADSDGGADDIACVRVADFDRARFTAAQGPTIRSVPRAQRLPRLLRRGDVLLEKSGGTQDKPVGCAVSYMNDEPAVCSNFVAALRPAPHVVPRFAGLLLAALYQTRRNGPFVNQTTGIQNLDSGAYLSQEIWVPSYGAQEAIVNSVEAAGDRAGQLMSLADSRVRLLQERKQALITAAVTGQFDVTTARAVA